jgi:5-methylthioribose kinase
MSITTNSVKIQLEQAVEISTLQAYLVLKKWLKLDEKILKIEKPGEGNMNLVLRVVTNKRSFILKQSKPYVQKYQQIPAPIGRIEVERKFYKLLKKNPVLSDKMPKIVSYDAKNYLLVLQDLGVCSDFTYIYNKGKSIKEDDLKQALNYLSQLHSTKFSDKEKNAFPSNIDLRKLNAQHLFEYPFMEENGFDLDTIQEGLAGLAKPYKLDKDLKYCLEKQAEFYLTPREKTLASDNNYPKIEISNNRRYTETLLHGDFYPGSWLKTAQGFKVIDPEFAFFGAAEYDYGVLVAHLMMAQTPTELMAKLDTFYCPPKGFNQPLAKHFAGMEILRRIIGLAQLPLDMTLVEKAELLEKAAYMVKN